MYQVIQIYGNDEPWWFFDDWEKDIIEEAEFDTLEEAEDLFLELNKKLAIDFEETKCKNPYLVAFWNQGDMIFCEDCDEDLQAFRGLMLLKDYKKLNMEENTTNEAVNYSGKAKCCQRYSQSYRGN